MPLPLRVHALALAPAWPQRPAPSPGPPAQRGARPAPQPTNRFPEWDSGYPLTYMPGPGTTSKNSFIPFLFPGEIPAWSPPRPSCPQKFYNQKSADIRAVYGYPLPWFGDGSGDAPDGRGRPGEGGRHPVLISSRLLLPVSAPPGHAPMALVYVGNRTPPEGLHPPGSL